VTLALAIGVGVGAAGAHPSPLNSLTIDVVLDQAGVVVIDAATNHETYQAAPSPGERATIAARVVEAKRTVRVPVGVPCERDPQ
jgi:hypothetical protein